jgi:anti-sigma-K factor RskA
MYDAELDALAAEYVLGTLPQDERRRAQLLLEGETGLAELVHQWERRLGELNVMIESVEPPAEVWEVINSQISALVAREQPSADTVEKTRSEAEADAEGGDGEGERQRQRSPILAALASSLLTSKDESEAKVEPEPEASGELEEKSDTNPSVKPVGPTIQAVVPTTDFEIGRNADAARLSRRVRRWRRTALYASLVALGLALVIAVSQLEPDLMPGQVYVPQVFGVPTPTSQRNSLVAVLQHDPTAPAFLVTVDATSRTLTVRRVAAKVEPGHAYELWVIAPPSAKPRSLGLVGGGEYTQRPLPADFNLSAARTAQYEISYEPAGGSRRGEPSGPILFRGSMVETLPPAPPAPPRPATPTTKSSN